MDIIIADERAFVLDTRISMKQAEQKAWSKKLDAFGTIVKVGSFLQKPKEDDFELVYKEHRYEPFWHIISNARYVYERRRDYPLAFNDTAVKTVTIQDTDYPVIDGKIMLSGLESCTTQQHEDCFFDGFTSQKSQGLATYMKHNATEIPQDQVDEFSKGKAIVLPTNARASAIVNKVITGMIKNVDADRILEDTLEISCIDIYYHPVYAFQYRCKSKDKEAVLEFDAVTEQCKSGGKTFQQYIGKIVDPNFIFDIGVDTADLLFPGGGIAVKLAMKGINAIRRQVKK